MYKGPLSCYAKGSPVRTISACRCTRKDDATIERNVFYQRVGTEGVRSTTYQ